MKKYKLNFLLLLFICFAGCQKNNDTTPNPTPSPTKSTNKSITTFIFRASDNPTVLSTDIAGVIGTDSILLTLPSGTNVTNIKPAISISGITVSPGNAASQNFTNPVTYTVTAEDGSIKNYIVKIYFQTNMPVNNGATIYIGNENQDFRTPIGYFYAIDAATGNVKWKYTTGSIYASATFSNGIVYVGEIAGLLALNAATGTLKWEYNTGNTIQSVPTVVNDIVYFGCNDQNLYAVNAITGILKWKSTLGYSSTQGAISSPTVKSGIVYIGSMDGNIYAYDANTGTLKWKFVASSSSNIQSSPAVVNGTLYVGCNDGNLYAVDANTGILKWKYSTGSIFSSPTVVNGIVYVGSSGNNIIYAIDAISGLEKWKYFTSTIYASPIISNGILYIGLKGLPTMLAIDASTGNLKWTQNYDNPFGSRDAAVFNGIVYVSNSNLLALDANNGSVKWKFLTDYFTDITASPCIVDSLGNIYHGGRSGDQN